MLSKRFDQLKYKIVYTGLISLSKIKQLPYFDNFESVMLDTIITNYPRHAKFIYFLANGTNIPFKVTHLTFGFDFNQPINNCIPSSVSHLIFGFRFNQPIKDITPSSVTHLTFGELFDQPINNCIPSSVSHLTFGWHFNQPINNCIRLQFLI